MSVTFDRRTQLVTELVAVVLSLLYTFRYINQERDCFFFGMAGAALFVVLCIQRKIYAEAFLQLFYVGFGLYGYLTFDRMVTPPDWGWTPHVLGIVGATAFMVLVAVLLPRYSDTQAPWLDAFTTSFSLWATWVMVQWIHENWLYWMVIDAVAIVLYTRRKLYWGAALFALYAMMAMDGYFAWKLFVW